MKRTHLSSLFISPTTTLHFLSSELCVVVFFVSLNSRFIIIPLKLSETNEHKEHTGNGRTGVTVGCRLVVDLGLSLVCVVVPFLFIWFSSRFI